jgi:hypothetical protein
MTRAKANTEGTKAKEEVTSARSGKGLSFAQTQETLEARRSYFVL